MTTDRVALEKAIAGARAAWVLSPTEMMLIDAATKHLDTLPKVRTAATWQVQYAINGYPMVDAYRTYHEARNDAETLESQGIQCVHVVGPVMHCVPS